MADELIPFDASAAAGSRLPSAVVTEIGVVAGTQNFGTILIEGDSIGFGTGATTPANSFAGKLKADVEAQLLNMTVTVVNDSVAGSTTGAARARLEAALKAHRPKVVVLQKSINDTRTDLPSTPTDSDTNIRRMITMCRLAGALPVVVTSAPIDPAAYNNLALYDYSSVVEGRASNVLLRATAAAMGVQIADVEAAFGGSALPYAGLFNLSDGVHPNDVGHAGWSLTIAKAIAGLVQGAVGSNPNPYATVVNDTTTRADSTTSPGVADTGQAWSSATDWGIISNQLYAVTPADGEVVTIPAGASSDMEVSVLCRNPGGKVVPAVIARAADDNNHYLADLQVTNGAESGVMRIYKRVAGAYTVIHGPLTVAGLTPSQPVKLSLAVRGTNIRVSVNDIPIKALTDTSITTGTRAGIRQSGTDPLRFTNFKVTA